MNELLNVIQEIVDAGVALEQVVAYHQQVLNGHTYLLILYGIVHVVTLLYLLRRK